MHRLLPILAVAVCSLVSSSALAQEQGEPIPAPYTLILMDHGIYSNGSSSLLPNALKQTIDNFWTLGACTADDDWAACDDLLFGLQVHAGPDCESWWALPPDTSESARLAHIVAPAEDSGKDVGNNLKLANDPAICENDIFRNHAEGLRSAWNRAFPAMVDSDFDTWDSVYVPISNSEYATYYKRPHVGWYVIYNVPTDQFGTEQTDEMAETIRVARDMLNGTPTSDWGEGGTYASLPPMPTWVLVERRSDTQETLWAALVAGGGGTAVCEWRDDSGAWVEMNDTNATTAANYSTITQTDIEDYFCNFTSYTPAKVQIDQISNQTYEISLNDVEISLSGMGLATKPLIAAALAAKINSDPGPYTATASGDFIDITGSCIEFDTEVTNNLMTVVNQVSADWEPRYRCGPGDEQTTTGVMAYEGSPTLSQIRCHLRGDDTQHPDWNGLADCSGNQETDILGKFTCIRQLPWDEDLGRALTADDLADADGEVVIRFCRDGVVDDGDILDDNCVVLRESAGDITFINPDRTLFTINNGTGQEGTPCTSHTDCIGTCDDDDDGDGVPDYLDDDTDSRDAGTDDPLDGICSAGNKCKGGSIDTFKCPTDDACDTELDGRCGPGLVKCPEGFIECRPKFETFPEICNGLDDDCDGVVDNMSESWTQDEFDIYSLPDDHTGLDCNLIDSCVCPGGATDDHFGGENCDEDDGDDTCELESFDEYLDAWDPICECGEGLSFDDDVVGDAPPPESTTTDDQATCSAVSSDAVPASFLALIALGFAGLFRRRR